MAHPGCGRFVDASLAGSATIAMPVIWPSTTVNAMTESAEPSSRQDTIQGRPLTSTSRTRAAAPTPSCAPAATSVRHVLAPHDDGQRPGDDGDVVGGARGRGRPAYPGGGSDIEGGDVDVGHPTQGLRAESAG